MPRTHPAYPEEFKSEAVQMVRAGRSAGDVAAALGCSPQSVTNWVRTYERDQGIRADGLKTEEREELKRLRRENVRLKQERDLLKRAAAQRGAEARQCAMDGFLRHHIRVKDDVDLA
ncbi:MAG: transposase, partial [Thermoleophilia bacterium]|nr:transposase [Thermoleophilia bacterium]